MLRSAARACYCDGIVQPTAGPTTPLLCMEDGERHMHTKTSYLRSLAPLLWAALVASVMALVAGTASERADAGEVAGGSSASVPKLTWRPCPDPAQSGFDCATARVPLDYGKPRGPAIELAVIRHRATDPANRIGVLFFNPGGPGGAGTEDLPAFFGLFPKEVRERFDVISWDPRGVGASTAVQCFGSQEAENSFFSEIPFGFFPVGEAQQRAWIRAYDRFGQLCGRRNGDLLAHVSTADTARDMDLLRRAVGAKKLNYLGISYGSFLGATYANLFPDKVRAVVLDGNMDPVAYTKGGKQRTLLSTSQRLETDKAAAKTLNAFLTLCGRASKDRCAFSAGSAAATRAKWNILLDRLRRQPVTLEGQTFTYAVLASSMNAWLTTTQPVGDDFIGWTSAAGALEDLWQLTRTGETTAPADPAASAILTAAGRRPPDGRSSGGPAQRYGGPEQALAVECGESPNPRDPQVFVELDLLTYARAGDIGRWWVWNDEPCASWPARAADRYAGPWNRRTAKPILVVNNSVDPETPYEGAVAMTRYLARGRLLSVDGYGHSVLLNPSPCAKNYESNYFVDGALPQPGTVCQQKEQPFTTSPAS
jgi:pimeloyl-ACP methyl ester carboxylesterase